MRINQLNGAVQSLVSLLLPKTCLCCSERLFAFEHQICCQCLAELPYAHLKQRAKNNPLTSLLRARFPTYSALSLFRFEEHGAVRDILHQIKYKNNEELALWTGQQIGQLLLSGDNPSPDVLVPIPLHPRKLKKRGFNQSERLARGISQATGIPLNLKLLSRVAHQASQTSLSRMERWNNIERSFHLNSETLPPSHVALVDDMITTGSTLEACAKCLPSSTRISVLSIAYEA